MASRVFSAEKESGGSERNSNPQPQATLLIPLPLPLTVALHDLRVLAATLFLVVGMFISPLLLAFQRDLVILGISRKFFAVIIGAASTLALRPPAHILPGTINGG